MLAQASNPVAKSPADSPLQWLWLSKLPACLITRLLSLLISLMILATASAAMAWLERGDSGDAVSNLQNRLAAEGCYDGPITGHFGSLTQAGVIQCQLKYGLTPDGIVGPRTMAALDGVVRREAPPAEVAQSRDSDELQQGSRGEKVIALQRQLKMLGLYEGEIDGIFGPMTETAVVRFQQDSRLTQTGVFGEVERQTIAATPAPTLETPAGSQMAPSLNPTATMIRRNQLTLGDAGTEVERLQARLRELKYFDSKETGYYGELTKSAVSSFQTANRLSASGIADLKTLQALGLSAGDQALQTQLRGFDSRASATDRETFNREAFNNSGFTAGTGFTDSGSQGTPIATNNLGTADVSGRNRFVVIIPKRSGVSLNQVREIVPDAIEGRSSIGEFIQAGAFSNQQLAEQQSQRLKNYNFEARVAYR